MPRRMPPLKSSNLQTRTAANPAAGENLLVVEHGVEQHSGVRPFLKWAGGKRQLLPVLEQYLPDSYGRYFEPMLGGAALFFRKTPKKAILADINPELVNVYTVIQKQVTQLIADLKKHQHTEEYFYALRNVDREARFKRWGAVRRASRLIYLNKTCFNGLYRVNSRGNFNTPFGRYKNPNIVDEKNLLLCSEALQSATISCASFAATVSRAKGGDFVYFDPPYVPLNATAQFTSYSKQGFDREMQIALRDVCRELDKRGVHFLLSNSSAPFVKELYREFDLRLVDATRAINSKADRRGKIKEVLVKNY